MYVFPFSPHTHAHTHARTHAHTHTRTHTHTHTHAAVRPIVPQLDLAYRTHLVRSGSSPIRPIPGSTQIHTGLKLRYGSVQCNTNTVALTVALASPQPLSTHLLLNGSLHSFESGLNLPGKTESWFQSTESSPATSYDRERLPDRCRLLPLPRASEGARAWAAALVASSRGRGR